MKQLRLSYDDIIDAAFIDFVPDSTVGLTRSTYAISPSEIAGDIVNLRFDADDRLLSMELLSARSRLPLLSRGDTVLDIDILFDPTADSAFVLFPPDYSLGKGSLEHNCRGRPITVVFGALGTMLGIRVKNATKYLDASLLKQTMSEEP